MDLPQLNEDQILEVHDFFNGDAAALLFQRLEAETMADWILAQNVTEREACWQKLQALLALQAKLRDAPADKRLTERSQNARATNAVRARTETVDTTRT